MMKILLGFAGSMKTPARKTIPVQEEWIFVDKGNYLVRSLPFSL